MNNSVCWNDKQVKFSRQKALSATTAVTSCWEAEPSFEMNNVSQRSAGLMRNPHGEGDFLVFQSFLGLFETLS